MRPDESGTDRLPEIAKYFIAFEQIDTISSQATAGLQQEIEMPLRPEYTLHRSEFGAFLYAPIWEDRDEASLSVLSMLGRLDMDPWAEAARLAALPREAAAASLAAILSRVPRKTRGSLDDTLVVDRLVGLLPPGRAAAASAPSAEHEGLGHRGAAGKNALLWLVAALLAVVAALMASGSWT